MGQAIGQELVLAVGIALSPIPIIGVVLMLGTPRARSNGPAFVAGWVVGLATAGAIVLLLAGGANASEGAQPADWVNVLKLVLGGVLLAVALRKWRGRARDGDPGELPGWMRSVDHFTAGRAAALGATLSALNPKNLVLIVAAATGIAQTGIPAGGAIMTVLCLVIGAKLIGDAISGFS